MFSTLWPWSIHLKDICLRAFLIVGLIRAAFPLGRVLFVRVLSVLFIRTFDVVSSVLLYMSHLFVGFSTLLH
jgi:hypothetical protein